MALAEWPLAVPRGQDGFMGDSGSWPWESRGAQSERDRGRVPAKSKGQSVQAALEQKGGAVGGRRW